MDFSIILILCKWDFSRAKGFLYNINLVQIGYCNNINFIQMELL